MNSPIILIHGIRGSFLTQTYDDSWDTIWSGVQKVFESIWDLELDDSGEVERDKRDVITVTKIEALAYAELLGKLRKEFPGEPVYIFRYDWRLDNKVNAEKLSEFLGYLEKKTQSQKFRFVTHSMGGLIFAAFLALDSGNNLKKVDRAVMTVPPFRGAPESIRALEIGETSLFSLNASEAFRKIARTFPSIYQLVPSYQNPWKHHDPNADIWDIQFWQRRVKFDTRKRQPYAERDALMQKHLTRARQFYAQDLIDFSSLSKAERKKYMVVYGTGERTLRKITVIAQNSKREVINFFDFESRSNYTTKGDGTVPEESALYYGQVLNNHEINLSDQTKWWWPGTYDDAIKKRLAGFHGGFLALDKVQGIVIDWLAGRNVKPDWSSRIQR